MEDSLVVVLLFLASLNASLIFITNRMSMISERKLVSDIVCVVVKTSPALVTVFGSLFPSTRNADVPRPQAENRNG